MLALKLTTIGTWTGGGDPQGDARPLESGQRRYALCDRDGRAHFANAPPRPGDPGTVDAGEAIHEGIPRDLQSAREVTPEPRWISKKALLLLHEESLAEFGGARGLHDEGLLESALARPQND